MAIGRKELARPDMGRALLLLEGNVPALHPEKPLLEIGEVVDGDGAERSTVFIRTKSSGSTRSDFQWTRDRRPASGKARGRECRRGSGQIWSYPWREGHGRGDSSRIDHRVLG